MFFDESLSKEQMIEKAKKDARVDPEQLKQLIEYWGSQKAKELTEKNKENKAKQNEPHCTGTKTFARLIEEKVTSDASQRPYGALVLLFHRAEVHRLGEGLLLVLPAVQHRGFIALARSLTRKVVLLLLAPATS